MFVTVVGTTCCCLCVCLLQNYFPLHDAGQDHVKTVRANAALCVRERRHGLVHSRSVASTAVHRRSCMSTTFYRSCCAHCWQVMSSARPWSVPVDEIQSYFGEDVSMYFAFLSHFANWLWLPTIVGLVAFIHQEAIQSLSIPWLIGLGIIMTMWSCLFIEAWKRRQVEWACKWGTTGTCVVQEMMSLCG